MRFRFILLIFKPLFFISVSAVAQQNLFFTNYTSANGLSNNEVTRLATDRQGFLWIGTLSGLNRFDGKRFIFYHSLATDSSTISGNTINDLMTDNDGTLWVATAYGICYYDPEINIFHRVPLQKRDRSLIYNFEAFSIHNDSRGRILLCAGYYGLFEYRPKENRFVENRVAAQHSMGDGSPVSVISLLENTDGSYWLSNYSHLYYLSESENEWRQYANRITSSHSTASFQALRLFRNSTQSKKLWISTWGHGLVSFDETTAGFKSHTFESGKPHNISNIVHSVHGVKPGILWAATNDGVKIFNEISESFGEPIVDKFNKNTVINQMMVRNILFTADSGLWIGSAHGLAFCNLKQQNFTVQQLLPTDHQQYLFDQSSEKVYATRFYNNRALIIYKLPNLGKKELLLPGADEEQSEPFRLKKDRNGTVWIGATKGLYCYREEWNEVRKYALQKEISNIHNSVYVNDMLEDRNGNFWVACRGVLLKRSAGADKFTSIDSIQTNSGWKKANDVTLLASGLDGSILMYSQELGLMVTDIKNNATHLITLIAEKGTPISNVTGMASDSKGNVWMTTRNFGLIHLSRNEKLIAYVYDMNGHVMNDQYHLNIDKNDRPWFISGSKLMMFDVNSRRTLVYNKEDGLPETNYFTYLHLLPDGRLSYNISEGVFAFDPEHVVRSGSGVSVHFYSVMINGRNAPLGLRLNAMDTLTLHHHENNLVFDFGAINFFSPSTTVYSYKLEGADQEWSAPTVSGILSFNQLRPGNYRLRIRAGSPAIPEHSPEKALVIRIVPAWYQTVWFYWILGGMLLAVVYFTMRFLIGMRYRSRIVKMEHEREIELIRSGIARDIHDEIGAGLTKIKLMSRKLLKNNSDAKLSEATCEKIMTTSDEMIRGLGEIVWTINPENDSIANVVAYIRIYLSRLQDENPEITFRVDLPGHGEIPSELILSPDIKRQLMMVLKESLTNIFKHSLATQTEVSLTIEKNALVLIVKDNGIGFDPELNHPGNGLKNMRKRAESLGAEIEIQSVAGGGCVVKFALSRHGAN